MGNPATVQRIRELRQQASLDIIFQMETKNPDSFVLSELDFLETDHHFLVPPVRPSSGALALFLETRYRSPNSVLLKECH